MFNDTRIITDSCKMLIFPTLLLLYITWPCTGRTSSSLLILLSNQDKRKSFKKKKKRSGYHFNWSVVSSHSPLVCWVQLLCDLDLHFWGYSDGGLSPHKFKAHLLLCCAVGSCRYSKMTLQSLLFGSKILLCFHPYPTFMLNLWITKIFILMFPKLNVL